MLILYFLDKSYIWNKDDDKVSRRDRGVYFRDMKWISDQNYALPWNKMSGLYCNCVKAQYFT